MTVEFTPQQQQAIDARRRSLIVSAAAGSGKTAVLVRRVIGLITGEDAVNLNQLLIVTFTNAAAGEMRARIGKALGQALAESPGQHSLTRQLAQLSDCRIQTVHAFCQDLLRRHAALLDIPGDFVIADETRCDILMDQAMAAVLEEAYANADPAFMALADNLRGERDDRVLEEVVRDLHTKLQSYADPQGWLERGAVPLTGHPQDSHWGREMMAAAHRRLEWAMKRVDLAFDILEDYPDIAKKYGNAFLTCREYGHALSTALAEGWDAAHALLMGFEKPSFDRGLRNADKTITGDLSAIRDEFAEIIEGIGKECIPVSGAEMNDQLVRTAPMTGALCRLVADFGAVFGQLKRDKGLLDFSDLEHYALALLRDADGRPSTVAEALRAELQEVLVDEYQDTNEIQEEIYTLIAPRSGSQFFVGDIKQSIYRFRRANPEIFIRRYLSSLPLEEEGRNARLALNRNFRSLENVLSLSNFVFSRIMSAQFGDIDYNDDQRLYAHREGEGQSELWLIDATGIRQEEDEAVSLVEARLVAARVAQMLERDTVPEGSGRRPLRPSDIVILLSSFTGKAPIFARALSQRGIPVSAPEKEDFFAGMEIAVLLSYLRLIDNRYQDIPLVSVLRSPLYMFSADQLAALRQTDRQAPLIDCLMQLAKEGDEACAGFLADLEAFSSLSCDLSVSQLLGRIISDTGAIGAFCALDNGPARRARMDALVQMALDFEGGAAKGVYPFLRYIDRRMEREESRDAPLQGDGVRLMSIHKSKGLEFPVVVVPDLGKQFNRDDLKKQVLLSPSLGIGMRLRNHASRTESKTCLQTAIATAMKRESGGEEMRKLYVAMTRAREKLVLVLSAENLPQKARRWGDEGAGRIHPEFLAAQGSAAPWVCAALMTHPGAQALRELAGRPIPIAPDGKAEELACTLLHWSEVEEGDNLSNPAQSGGEAPETEAVDYAPWLAQIEAQYPFMAVSALPSKLTPAGVRLRLEDAGEIEGSPDSIDVRMYRKSDFQSHSALTAAQRGTATHLFLCHADLRLCAQLEGARQERDRLVQEGRLNAPEGDSLDLKSIQRFAASPVGRRASDTYLQLREYRFGVLFTPHELLGNGIEEEEILLNGAIDMLLLDGDEMEIIDFKTDSVADGEEQAAAQKHRLQLELYAKAAEKIFGGRVRAKTVVFLKTGKAVEV